MTLEQGKVGPAADGGQNGSGSMDQTKVLHRPLFCVSFPLFFISFALPVYAKSMGASALEIGGLFSVFTVSLLVIRPLVGVGLDRFGRRIFLISALIIYGFANIAFSFTTELPGLYLARFTQGLGASFLLITIDTITADLTTPDNRTAAMGRNLEKQTRGAMIGTFMGFTLIGALPIAVAWKYSFIGYAVLAFVGAWFSANQVPETRARDVEVMRGKPWRGVKLKPQLIRLMLVVFAAGFASALIQPIYLIYLQDKFTVDMGRLAAAFFPAAIVYMVLPSRLGTLSDRFGRSRVMALGMLATGLMYASFPVLPNMIWLVILYTLSAVGSVMADLAKTAMVGDIAGEEERGRIFGVYQLTAGIGASVGPLVGGWVYDHLGNHLPFYMNGALLILSALWAARYLGSDAEAGSPSRESKQRI